MKHLGDITKINGHNVPITDCVIFGAPCQDLSVAGKRAGMKHSDLGDEETTRSGLFMEAVRIIKEMREQDVRNGRSGHNIRPRYGIYENVPGAFSSNGGEDFRVVLEELARVVEEGVTIPRPEKGKWATTGVIIGDNWSLAWRVFDAQYWGVPQRRRRICIVVDFNGHTAPQIVFSEGEYHGSTERGNTKPSVGHLGEEPRSEVQPLCEGLPRNIEQSLSQGEEAPSDASRGFGAGDSEGITFEPGIASREGGHIYEGVSGTLGQNNGVRGDTPIVIETSDGDVAGTLDASYYKGCGERQGKERTFVVKSVDCRNCTEDDVNGSLQSNSAHSLNGNNVVRVRYIVRRLTPLECERLQGFPDGHTDIGEYTDTKGKKGKTSDASRYKALGNSISLPNWKFIIKRLCACYERDATMASLFDGIGGFPHLWEQINGKGSCLWASEIEEFPIAVTSRRFNDE